MDSTETCRTTRPRRATWLGIKGETWDFLKTSNRNGERVGALRWLEDNPNTGNKAGDLVLSHVTGNAWTKPETFQKFSEVTIPNGTEVDAVSFAKRCLAKGTEVS